MMLLADYMFYQPNGYDNRIRYQLSAGDSEYFLRMEVPGSPKEDLKITSSEGEVSIQGWKRTLDGENQEFTKSFSIPAEIDADRISAELADGILTLTMPKKQALARTIPVLAPD